MDILINRTLYTMSCQAVPGFEPRAVLFGGKAGNQDGSDINFILIFLMQLIHFISRFF